jgi:hypothetical protein
MSRRRSGHKNYVAVIALVTALISLFTAALPHIVEFIQPVQEKRARSTLLSYLPAKVRSTCTTDTSDDFPDALASVECDARGVNVVRVGLYGDSASLYAHYHQTLKKVGLKQRQGPGCDEGQRSESNYSAGDVKSSLGRYVCWIDGPDKVARLEWTVSDISVQAYAFSSSKDLRSLHKWWQTFYIGRDNAAEQ